VAKKQRAKEKVTQAELRIRKQVLLLWAILGEGGGEDVSRPALEKKGMLPDDDKAARDALEAQGLINDVSGLPSPARRSSAAPPRLSRRLPDRRQNRTFCATLCQEV
jgi:hypothetical protein